MRYIIYIKTNVSYAKPFLLIWLVVNAYVWVEDIANEVFPDEIHFRRCATAERAFDRMILTVSQYSVICSYRISSYQVILKTSNFRRLVINSDLLVMRYYL